MSITTVKDLTLRLEMYSATSVGRVRKINQDSHAFDATLGFGVIADGIGGKPGGEIASQLAVKTVHDSIRGPATITYSRTADFMLRQVKKSHQAILNYGEKNPQYQGMGTTMDFLFFVGETVNIAHAGDSRTYVFFRNHLFQLTIDHNIETFAERGILNARSKTIEKRGSRLTKGLGILDEPDPDFYQKRIYLGEIYLTASDGLFDMVEDGEIKKIMATYQNRLSDLPRLLVSQANKNGGRDNTTVLICAVIP